MTRHVKTSEPKTPVRTCVAGGGEGERGGFLRFIAGPDGLVHFDPSGKGPGRGAYVTPRAAMVTHALKKGALARALEAPCPPDLVAQIRTVLRTRAMAHLGLLKKASCLVTGSEKVADTLAKRKAIAVIVATDAAPSTLETITRQAHKAAVPLLQIAGKDMLSSALGQNNCVIIALLVGPGHSAAHNHMLAPLLRLHTFDDANEDKNV